MSTKQMIFNVDEQIKNDFKAFSSMEGMTMSAVISVLMKTYIEDKKKEITAKEIIKENLKKYPTKVYIEDTTAEFASTLVNDSF